METKLAVLYEGPPGLVCDALGGELVPGETYIAPDKAAHQELLDHPAGWYKAASSAKSKEPTDA